jgi:acyl-CoA thioester hydrolase
MEYYHSFPVQIRFNDVDQAQHVNNSVYLEYLDLGRVDYFKNITGSPMSFDGLALVIASIRVDFFQPVFPDDQIRVLTKVVSLGTKSLEMMQQIVSEGCTGPKAESKSVLVCFDYKNQISEILPDEWKKKIKEFEHAEVTEKSSL